MTRKKEEKEREESVEEQFKGRREVVKKRGEEGRQKGVNANR